jgi:hypothetical protein
MKYRVFPELPVRWCDPPGRPLRVANTFPTEDCREIPAGEIIELVRDLADPREVVILHRGRYYNIERRFLDDRVEDFME